MVEGVFGAEDEGNQDKARRLLEDVNYGLSGSPYAYFSWSAFGSGAPQGLRTAWHWELRSYFGLTHA